MSGSNSYFVIENNKLISYTGPKDAHINIPDGVTTIGDNVFKGCTGFITIPNSVTTIGMAAFLDCTSLWTIPKSVTTIGIGAFLGCTSLRTIPNSVKTIGRAAFKDCTSLITIPNSVTTIGRSAFKGCTSLITIPNRVTTISGFAFEKCISLTTIPNSVRTIGDFAFQNCTRLTTIPNRVTTIGDFAFNRCASLTTIPNSVMSIGGWAFQDCVRLESVELNAGVVLKANSFQGCNNLKHLFIADDQVERIKAILPADQKHLVFGKSSKEYKFYSLSLLDKNHDENINKVIRAAYSAKLGKLDAPDVTSTVCAFLNQEDLKSLAATNKSNSNLFNYLNELEKPARPLTFSSIEKYDMAMAAYKAELAKVANLGEEALSRPFERLAVSGAGAGAGAAAGAGADMGAC